MLRNTLWFLATIAISGLLVGFQTNLPAHEGKDGNDRNPACASATTPAPAECEDHGDGQGSGSGGKPGEAPK